MIDLFFWLLQEDSAAPYPPCGTESRISGDTVGEVAVYCMVSCEKHGAVTVQSKLT